LNVLLVALGSAGDVFPFLGLGRGLLARGHQVTLLANDHFEATIRRAGLEFAQLGTEAEYHAVTSDPMLWSPIHGIRCVAKWLILRYMRRTFEIVRDRYRPGETLMAAPLTAFGARIVQERLGIPLVTVSLQPSALRSALEPAVVRPLPLSRKLPVGWNRLLYGMADWAVFNPLVREETNAFRAELGLSPVRGSFMNWAFSPSRILGLFPDWFGPPAADWPTSVRLCQFPLYDADDRAPLSPEAARFLDAGDPPFVFTAGSAMRHSRTFFKAAVKGCRLLGARGVLVSPYQDQIPGRLPSSIHWIDSIPFGRLFPRAAGVIHHGGIGTSSQALLAGVPQLVMPMAFDQHDNADRLQRLGVARTLAPARFRGPRVARMLQELHNSPEVLANCRVLSDRLASTLSDGNACHWIEQALAGGP
jgi:UDP:flavonoid glycosyltransferase YjiC (YdhE family)